MAAQYEKRVLTMNAWGQKQGYPPFCEVVTQEDGLANLQLIVDKVRGKEVPRVPAVRRPGGSKVTARGGGALMERGY